MKCPACKFDNREGAQFSKECGKNLSFYVHHAVILTNRVANSVMNAVTILSSLVYLDRWHHFRISFKERVLRTS